MKNQRDPKIIIESLLTEVEKYTIKGERGSYILDPVFGIVRNRVNTEVAKTYFRTHYPEKGIQLMKYVQSEQADDGSWNEIHPHYNQKSALVTSFIGSGLVIAYPFYQQDTSLEKAKNFVLQNEMKSGYFKKSRTFTADHLNVDASCGAFLAEYGDLFSDTNAIHAARRAAEHVCRFQKKGWFPYTIDKGNYPYTYNIPCIHYQGVTLYYLLKIQKIIDEPWLKKSIDSGTAWLASVQFEDGSFDWSKSGLMFSYYLSGAYAFAFAVFTAVSLLDNRYSDNAQGCLNTLEKNMNSISLRWETDTVSSLLMPEFTTLRSMGLGEFPLSHRIFRLGYGSYRQVGRRRIKSGINDTVFHTLCGLLHITPSTIEPMNNYPDLFMTSEILDCLSSVGKGVV
jgi:hypothetical protein